MDQNSFGVQLSYASVDRGDGTDPREAALAVLRQTRVLAGLRDAGLPWEDGTEAVLLIPVTDDARVLTLSDDDTIVTEVAITSLRDAFADVGLNLWIDGGQDDEFAEFEAEFDADAADAPDAGAEGGEGESAEGGDVDPDEDIDLSMFEPQPVEVSAFSHRGPVVARFLAEANRTPVQHVESGSWSLQRFRSTEPTNDWPASAAELPVIELNRTGSGADWIEVTVRANETVPFWTDAERDTRPVLDVDAITVPETAEVYRRLLTEGDGTRDELDALGARGIVDAETAHRALVAEALGGVVGSDERLRAFLGAFGIPTDLIEAALAGEVSEARRFAPRGWAAAIGDSFLAGVGEWTPLTRRETAWARAVRFVRSRPAVGVAIGVAELAGGVALTKKRGIGRVLGILFIVDAFADLAIWALRLRRR